MWIAMIALYIQSGSKSDEKRRFPTRFLLFPFPLPRGPLVAASTTPAAPPLKNNQRPTALPDWILIEVVLAKPLFAETNQRQQCRFAAPFAALSALVSES